MKGEYFTVQNSVACGQHWSDYFTFKFDILKRQFLFNNRVYENWVFNSSTKSDAEVLKLDTYQVTKAKKEHPILFENYKPD